MAVTAADDRLGALKRVFDTMYSSSATDQDLDRTISDLYDEKAVFEDVMTYVDTRTAVHAQFLAIRRFTKEMHVEHVGEPSEGEIPADAGGLQQNIAAHEHVLAHYLFPLNIRVTLEQTTALVFDKETGKIVRHIDSWYIHDTLKRMWGWAMVVKIFDAVHHLLRKAQGYLSTPIYLALLRPTPALKTNLTEQGRAAAIARVWVPIVGLHLLLVVMLWVVKRIFM